MARRQQPEWRMNTGITTAVRQIPDNEQRIIERGGRSRR